MSVDASAGQGRQKSQRPQQEALAFDVSAPDSPQRAVLVTGGARRIGRAICEELAGRGWHVVIHARRADDPDAAALAARLGGSMVAEELAEPLAAARLFQSACDRAPGLCAIVNNASVFSVEKELPSESILALRRVNVEVPEKLTTLLGLRLMEHPPFSGAVVDLLDSRVLRPVSADGETPYVASKRDLYKSIVRSAGLFASSLRVNGIAPGPVLAPANPANRVPGGETLLPNRPSPKDVAAAAAFLLEASAVTGQVIAVDSGQHLLVR